MPIYSHEALPTFERWKAAYAAESEALKVAVAAKGSDAFFAKFEQVQALHDESMRLFDELQRYRID